MPYFVHFFQEFVAHALKTCTPITTAVRHTLFFLFIRITSVCQTYLGDVHAQPAVDASTAHADEDTSVDGGPAGTGGAPAPHTVCTLLVVRQVQQLLQGC